MKYVNDITGRKFGRITIIGLSCVIPHKPTLWYGVCECGNQIEIQLSNRKNPSCGCYRRERAHKLNFQHGEGATAHRSPEFISWSGMKQRCYYKFSRSYKDYGGRVIRMCETWKNSYLQFLNDMGRRPTLSYSIDRIDVNGNYEPSNCRWATSLQQCNNKRNTPHGQTSL